MLGRLLFDIISTASIAFLIIGCRDEGLDNRVVLINNTDSDVLYNLTHGFLVGDTAVPFCDYYERVAAGDTVNVSIQGSWEELYLNAAGGTVNWFLYAPETIDTATCDEIKRDYLVLKRYDLTLDSMYKNDWTIVYP